MATLALAAVGAAVGGAILPAGITVLGATLTGAAIGSQLGAMAGSVIDQSLFAASGQSRPVSGPRLADLHVTASTEGAAIPRLYGRARVGGQLIWAADFEEEAVHAAAGGRGKGGATGGTASTSGSIEYRYYASFAVALCEGEISGLGRVWADGREIDLADYTVRLHSGSEAQLPDSLIAAHLGDEPAPAYRGVAYVVLERLPLRAFGNRIPQLSFEVHRILDDVNRQVRGVVLIPGSGEFVYAPDAINRDVGLGHAEAENVHTRQGGTDWHVAIDQLQATLPNVASVSLVVSWFGTDLRAGDCQLRPSVEITDKATSPLAWAVAGVTRTAAAVVSQIDGRPAYGGTPSDASVVAAIRDLGARDLSVVLDPFVLMDVPAGNALPDPWSTATSQPTYPWRGRITCDPAPGRPGTPDKTAAAATQLASFIGTALPSHFALDGDEVVYTGPAEWSYRRMILHYAWLAKAAGGVDGFLIGSELRGLTHVRSATSTYPFVTALVALAADVRAILGTTTKITYAADWSEYFGHQPADGSGDVHFHLDPLWSSAAIDAVGIDLYWPLADWRDGRTHRDYLAGTTSDSDLAYLKSNIVGGEGYDWYYASQADRDAQVRTPITDGAGKPWVFRFKDIRSWWLNAHHDRPGGIESTTPTGWVPQSKPFWLMEFGCPAVDKGANQPNVFVDAKSADSSLPHYSRGTRNDLAQRRVLQALLEAFDPDHPGQLPGANPVSAITGDRMVSLAHMHAYAWDARPYPAFPNNPELWSDAANWSLGHWLNGRLASCSLADLVARILDDHGFPAYDVSRLTGTVPGYVVDRVMSAREALQPIELAFFVDAIERDGAIAFRHRGAVPSALTLSDGDLVETRADAPLSTLTRGQETDLPVSARIAYVGSESDYRQAIAEASRRVGGSARIAEAQLPVVMEAGQAQALAESWLFEAWVARERLAMSLPPSRLVLEPGDTIAMATADGERPFRITEIAESGIRGIAALAIDPDIYVATPAAARRGRDESREGGGAPFGLFLDLPRLASDHPAQVGYVAAVRNPWPGAVAFYRSPETAGYTLRALPAVSASIGTTLDHLPAGCEGRLDKATRLRIRMDAGALSSTTRAALLAGVNAAAVQAADGIWEVLQFRSAVLVAADTFEIAELLRGQLGTEGAMHATVPLAAGARIVVLDAAVTRVDMSSDDIGLLFNWRYGPASAVIGSTTYASTAHAFRGVGHRPLSPVHVRGRRSGSGLTVSWVRRTRVGGDGWDAVEVPLGEESERYEVDILAGSSIVRTISSAVPEILYTPAQEIADFGSAQSAITVGVFQISATAGRGAGRQATL